MILRTGNVLVQGVNEESWMELLDEKVETEIALQREVTAKIFLPRRDANLKEALMQTLKDLDVDSINGLILDFPKIDFDTGDLTINEAETQEWLAFYRQAEEFHKQGLIKRIGLANFGVSRLKAILPHVKLKPELSHINIHHCCSVPMPVLIFAKEHGIELIAHNDTLQLSDIEHALEQSGRPKHLDWMVKYSCIVRDTGVVGLGYILSCT